MKNICARFHRLHRVAENRQIFIFHLDQSDGSLGFCFALSNNDRHLVSNETHDIGIRFG